MKKLKNIYTVFILLIVVSCSDSFVDVPSPDENSENYFNSESDYQLALVAAYDYLQTTSRNYQWAEIASDNALCGGESANDTPALQQIDDMIHSEIGQNNPPILGGGVGNIWAYMFEGINRCNYIMEFKDKTDFPNKTNVIAQTRFLRAYYYFELVKWFGDVPLAIDKRIQFGDQFTIDRAPKEDVYALIEQDLIFAADNLNYVEAETGRVSKGAAQGMLGKAYLYQNKFTEAATVLEDLIDNGPHRLLTTAEYPNLFERDWENNVESVFEIQYSDVDGGSFECFQCLEGNYTVYFNGPRDFVDSTDKFDAGYSFNVPVQNLVDAFETGDLRLKNSILDIDQWIVDNPGSSYNENAGYEQTGYFFSKLMARKGDLNRSDPALTNPDNYRALRFADVLLMAAEALNRGNISDSRALIYLNRVRNRAMLPSVNLSGSNLTEAIYKERRIELCGEGHRFFDLVRTDRAEGTIPGFSKAKGHELFPIPIEEIQLSGNRWAQNPGY